MDLKLRALQDLYASEALTPTALIERQYGAWQSAKGTFVTLATPEQLLDRARNLEALSANERGALYGVPFAVKDNIDVAGFPTTAACEAFRHRPTSSAAVVDVLLAAGGIVVGKTNMDQFAAGLVGTRTPYGVAQCAFDKRFVPGGSSSGSGSAVGAGIVTFALGTDTAGSGRIPAMFNGCIGIKPTVGRLSTRGVVPACKSLDCVSVFAQSVADGAVVARIMETAQGCLEDETWQPPGPAAELRFKSGAPFRFAAPGTAFDSFAGPGGDTVAAGYKALFQEAIVRLEELGGTCVSEFDFSPFATTAKMLYETAFIAERYSGIEQFLHAAVSCGQQDSCRTNHSDSEGKAHENEDSSTRKASSSQALLQAEDILQDGRMQRVTRAIIANACGKTAVELYGNLGRLRELKAQARTQMAKVDLVLVPTAAHHYTIDEVLSQEDAPGKVSWEHNANLGRFTNFVNLLDMAGISVPSGLLHCNSDSSDVSGKARRESLAASGSPAPVLPFGITLLGAAWSDEYLWGVAADFSKASGLGCGRTGHGLAA